MAEEEKLDGFAWMSKDGEQPEKVLQADIGTKMWMGFIQCDAPSAKIQPSSVIAEAIKGKV